MRALAAFIMGGWSNALLATVVSAVLAFLLPPLANVSAGAVALVALRKGPRDGLWLWLGATLILAAVGWVSLGTPLLGLAMAVLLWLPVWLIAWVLRWSISLPVALEALTVLGAVLLAGLYLGLGEPGAVWGKGLREVLGPALEQAGSPQEVLDVLAARMHGLIAVSLVVNTLVGLLLGRWWQAALYNPGGFQTEFHQLRLQAPVVWGAAALVAVAWMVPSAGGFLLDLSLLLLVLLATAGLAVVHGSLAAAKGHVAWLVGLYVLMFVALVQVVILLALVAVLDTRLDFRARLARRT